jgi:hypothetical protein
MTKEDRKGRAKRRREDNRYAIRSLEFQIFDELNFQMFKYGTGDSARVKPSPIRMQNNQSLTQLAHLVDRLAIVGAAAHRELERRFANTRKQRRQIEARLKYMHTPEAQRRHLQRRMKGATIPM